MTLRITGGEARGRLLRSPRGYRVRPTSARVRQALFNILKEANEGADWLDLFAGCGAVGLEALSRGARSVTFIEKDGRVCRVLQENIRSLGWQDRGRVWQGEALHYLREPPDKPFDVVFLDPPYAAGLYERALACLLSPGWLGDDSLVIVEHGHHVPSLQAPPGLILQSSHRYGDTGLILYRKCPPPPGPLDNRTDAVS